MNIRQKINIIFTHLQYSYVHEAPLSLYEYSSHSNQSFHPWIFLKVKLGQNIMSLYVRFAAQCFTISSAAFLHLEYNIQFYINAQL